jgi:hypothetical protein
MSAQTSEKANTRGRLDRTIRRERLQSTLRIAGCALAIGGLVMAVFPIGPSLAKPDVIPKADPYAGLWFAQALSQATAIFVGVSVAIAGLAILLLQMLLGIKFPKDNDRSKH